MPPRARGRRARGDDARHDRRRRAPQHRERARARRRRARAARARRGRVPRAAGYDPAQRADHHRRDRSQGRRARRPGAQGRGGRADARAARAPLLADGAGRARHARDRRSHVRSRHPVHLVLAAALDRRRGRAARAARDHRPRAGGASGRARVSPEWIGAWSVVALIALVLLRVPVAIAMGLVGLVGYALVDDWSAALNRLGNTPFELAESYSLSVVPLFLLMGAVAARSGMSRDLFAATSAVFAGRRGTVAMATVGACAGLGAICGSSLATAATMSRIAIPEMRRLGYDGRLAAGAVASGGTLGMLIPPSVILIDYDVMAQDS